MNLSFTETNSRTEPERAPRVPVHWEEWQPPENLRCSKTYMQKHAYSTHVAGLDVETSTDGRSSWIYLWCIAVDDELIYGRTINDLKQFLRRLAEFADLRPDFQMVVYIHIILLHMQHQL